MSRSCEPACEGGWPRTTRGIDKESQEDMQPRIIIADEYPVVLFGAEDALVRYGWQVALTTSMPARLPSLLSIVACSVLVIDPFQSREFLTDGAKLLAELRRAAPRMRIIVFTEACSERVLRSLVELGVHGVVWKGDGTAELAAAVEAVMAGERFVSHGIARRHPRLCPRRDDALELLGS